MSQTKCPFLRQLLQYLLVKLAPVILRVKPAGMLRLTNCRQLAGGRQYDLFCVHQREVMESLKLECRILPAGAGFGGTGGGGVSAKLRLSCNTGTGTAAGRTDCALPERQGISA